MKMEHVDRLSNEAPRGESSERAARKAKEALEAKEQARIKDKIINRANSFLGDAPFALESDGGEVKLAVEVEEERFETKALTDFDPEELMRHPEFRTETRRIGDMEYVVTERIRQPHAREQVIVRPDGRGLYPEKEDLQAAFQNAAALGFRWGQKMPLEQASLIIHHFHRKPSEWLWRATEALVASDPDLSPEDAVKRAKLVIYDLIERHMKHSEHA